MSATLDTPNPVAPEDVILVGGEALYDLVYDGSEDLHGHPGGAAFNTARTIGRLGQPVAYLGRLSTDRFGTTLERMLAADGVRLDAVVRTDEPTTLALAELDDTGSARYRFYERATSAPGLTPEAALAALPPAVGILHVGTLGLTLEPMATALEAVVEELSGTALVMVDPNVRPWVIGDADTYRRRLRRVLARSDVVKVSEEDLAWLEPQRRRDSGRADAASGRTARRAAHPRRRRRPGRDRRRRRARGRARRRGRRHHRRRRRLRRRLPRLVALAGPRPRGPRQPGRGRRGGAPSAPSSPRARVERAGASPPFLRELEPAATAARPAGA